MFVVFGGSPWQHGEIGFTQGKCVTSVTQDDIIERDEFWKNP